MVTVVSPVVIWNQPLCILFTLNMDLASEYIVCSSFISSPSMPCEFTIVQSPSCRTDLLIYLFVYLFIAVYKNVSADIHTSKTTKNCILIKITYLLITQQHIKAAFGSVDRQALERFTQWRFARYPVEPLVLVP